MMYRDITLYATDVSRDGSTVVDSYSSIFPELTEKGG